MGDDLRYRLKSKSKQSKESNRGLGKSESIFGIWEEQRRMQSEEDKMARELAETKHKARELSKTLRKHRYGEIKHKSLSKSKFDSAPKFFISFHNKISSKIKKSVKSHKKLATGLASVAVVLFVGIISYSLVNPNPTATLGDSNVSLPITDQLPREKPSFPILYPSNKSSEDFDVVRISPDGADVSYTFLDRFTDDGQIFKVTQQEVPDNFNLEKVSTDFQATNVIQVDENKIYHGYSEKGGVQSLIFIKNKKLVTVRSPEKFTDDQWAAYYISLE